MLDKMNMQACPECQKAFSNEIDQCPHCGWVELDTPIPTPPAQPELIQERKELHHWITKGSRYWLKAVGSPGSVCLETPETKQTLSAREVEELKRFLEHWLQWREQQ